MAAYVILDVEISDPAVYETYKKQSTEVLQKYGGKFLVRGGLTEVLEGDRHPHRVVVLEFDTMEAARRWWASPEYEGPKATRMRSSNSNMILVQGVENP